MKKAKLKRSGIILTSVLLSMGPLWMIRAPLFLIGTRVQRAAQVQPAPPRAVQLQQPKAAPVQQGN
jgi:hypothetical protein